MFIDQELIPDKRPFMAVSAPGRDFILKYFDRQFDRRITNDPDEAEKGSPAVLIVDPDEAPGEEVGIFADKARRGGHRLVTVSVRDVIGTGMTGLMMRLARGVARGTLMKIRDNAARWSVTHAVDVARAAEALCRKGEDDLVVTVSADPVSLSDLVDALGVRIKDKRVGVIAPRWARILYGADYYGLLTSDRIADASEFRAMFPDFIFNDPTQYLTTHVYDNDSL